MARGKDWSADELEYLREVWGEKTIPQIAKKLGRSINAVKIKSVRLGYRSQKWCGEMMSARKVSELLGVDIHAITDYWIPKCGLKGKKKQLGESGQCTIVYFNDLLKWLENNQDKWDSRRVEQYGLGCEYPWLIEKRKSDSLIPKKRFKKWTPLEDAQLVQLFKSGDYTRHELGELLDRSASSVEHRLLRLDVWGTGQYMGDAKKREQRINTKAKLEKRVLLQRLHDALLFQRNQLAFDGYWQKDVCMHWHPVNGCTKEQENCDMCASFQRMPPQNCVRCGITFFERQPNRICSRCRQARIKQAQIKWARMGKCRIGGGEQFADERYQNGLKISGC